MFRLVLFTFFVIFASMSSAYAQDTVRVRAGDHDDYARVVFDWGKRVNYTASTEGGKLVLTFDVPASVNDSEYKADPPKNVSGMNVVSTSPLKVELTLAPGSTTRDFSSDTKVVIDVYDPPGAKKEEPKPEVKAEAPKETPKPEPKKEEPKPEPKKVEAKPAEVKLKPGETKITAPKDVSSAPAVPVATVGKEENIPPGKMVHTKPNIITFTATKATGLAVYERAGKVWMITDQEDLILSPNVTGPDAEKMMPPGAIQIVGGKGYTFPKLGGRSIQGQAGGLVWRIIVAPQEIYLESIKPKRFDDNGDEPGGGKLVWDMQEPGRVLDVPDPVTGRNLKVVTVNKAKYLSGTPLDYVEFETILTPVGLVILPKVDDLTVEIKRTNVEVSRPGGLHLMSEKNVQQAMSFRDAKEKKSDPANLAQNKIPEKRIFDFNTWQMGGLNVLETNRNLVLSTLGGKQTPGQVEGLISLARMHLANGMWAEATGFLDFALQEQPELETNPEVVALNGAARAMGRVSDLAFEDLSYKELEKFPEIGYWRAYVLADLQDWQQAGEILPTNIEILAYYPENLLTRLGLVLAEVALRSGKLDEGEKILKLVEDHGGKLVFQQEAALNYLKGEAIRQRGKPDEAVNFWKPLTTGKDAMYRARAGLAITRLQYEKKKITAAQAIDSLERLRYAWRGDELEALINYWLGKVYFDTGEYIKALNIMRDAANFSEGTELGERIKTEMVETFITLFSGDDLKKISGPDAAALYDEFSSLIPAGEKGNDIAEKLADHLVSKELFERAISLLQIQVQRREGVESYRIATKLAAIELLDNKSTAALSTLGKATEILGKLPEELKTPERYQEVSLLRARALSQERRPDQALALLKDLPRSKAVNKLRADIAWRAGYWDDAAEALGDVINDEEISTTRPLSPENTNLIMRRAVALSLASDRIGLANMREKFTDSMQQTDKARIFEVITRARQSGALADRETLMGIVSEVDMFKEFLNSYKAEGAPAAAATTATPEADPAATPQAQ